MKRNCWCGNTDLAPFGSDYAECQVCGTLVSQNSLSDDQLIVKDDETDFYGKQYWLTHQNQDLGFPSIYARARNDLTERNLHWLRTLLKYRLPPANVLELGCSHGSFVALLQQTGYQASGVEMSPWVVSFGRDTFKVPIEVGPVETLNLPKESFDVIALMDVLEHLPDPLNTIGQCISLLKPDGLFLIQTPDFQEYNTYQTLIETKNPFLEQLKFDEHLYLFSRKSVCNFLKRLEYSYVQFEPAIFTDYDMFLVAGKVPLNVYTDEQWTSQFLKSPQGRITLALLDIRERELELTKRVSDLTKQLTECYQDLEDKVRQITNLSDWLKQTQSDLQTTNIELKTTHTELKTTQAELKTTQAELEAIRSSKFLKMRQFWINLKSIMGSNS